MRIDQFIVVLLLVRPICMSLATFFMHVMPRNTRRVWMVPIRTFFWTLVGGSTISSVYFDHPLSVVYP